MNFSSKHKLQRLLALLYGLARAIICHVITWLILLSFNDQTYLLSSVEFLDVVFLNEMNLFHVVDIGKNHYSVVIEQSVGNLYVDFKDIQSDDCCRYI